MSAFLERLKELSALATVVPKCHGGGVPSGAAVQEERGLPQDMQKGRRKQDPEVHKEMG